MSKFKVVVTRVDEYEIEVDENIWDEKTLADWSNVFTPVSSAEEVAKDFAVAFIRNENNYFIEGYGYVKKFNEDGSQDHFPFRDESGEFCYPLPEEQYTKGISIKPICQDYNYDTEISIIK